MHGLVINGPVMSGGDTLVAVLVPLGVMFLIVVAPVWLWLHYRRGGARFSEADRQAIATLARTAERLEARLTTVERAVLDAETGAPDQSMRV
jgi:phage shock protein B